MFMNYEEVTKENMAFENNGHDIELKVTSSCIREAAKNIPRGGSVHFWKQILD